jgi:hypothetical protein
MITNRIDNITNNLQKIVERLIEALHFSPCYKYGGRFRQLTHNVLRPCVRERGMCEENGARVLL